MLLAEPYLLPAVEQAGLDLPFIYDAFNVEADLKAAALPSSPLGLDLLSSVVDVERRAVLGAATTTTCSAEDADALAARYGRARADFVVIPNGTDTHVPVATCRNAPRQPPDGATTSP